jgi:hypothetical protein
MVSAENSNFKEGSSENAFRWHPVILAHKAKQQATHPTINEVFSPIYAQR